MGVVLTRKSEKKRRRRSGSKGESSTSFLPMKLVAFAAVPLALTVFYLGWVAPDLVPVGDEVKVAFPMLTKWMEVVVNWCAKNRLDAVLIGGGILLAGIVLKFFYVEELYYLSVCIIASAVLVLTYLSISAPIDRFLNSVESQMQDERVPSHNRTRETGGSGS